MGIIELLTVIVGIKYSLWITICLFDKIWVCSIYKIRMKHFINAKSHCYKFYVKHKHLYLALYIQRYSIQPWIENILGKSKFQKLPKNRTWICHMPSTNYTAFTLRFKNFFFILFFYRGMDDVLCFVSFRYTAKW